MRRAVIVGASCLIGIGSLGVGALALLPAQPEPPRVPVLVELFTSEGCSSCPPADELLIRLDEEQFVPGALVIPLSEHVAYWNGTWRDPFSDPGFTERQRTYHPLLGSTALYTPEMVVDGQAQFVGSQRMLAEHAIARATTTPKAVVDVSVRSAFAQGALQVELAISDTSALGNAAAVELWIAVAETGLETDVPRGENARRRAAPCGGCALTGSGGDSRWSRSRPVLHSRHRCDRTRVESVESACRGVSPGSADPTHPRSRSDRARLVHRRRETVKGSGSQRAQPQGAATRNT